LDKPEDVLVTLTLNGSPLSVRVDPALTLLGLLRTNLGLQGTRYGCGTGECGACTVELDGAVVNSCLVLAAELDAASIRTVEALASHGELSAVQQAFVDEGAVQCGYCTSGLVMVATAYLRDHPAPTDTQCAAALRGNLCRCTGYVKIIEAVRNASTAEGTK